MAKSNCSFKTLEEAIELLEGHKATTSEFLGTVNENIFVDGLPVLASDGFIATEERVLEEVFPSLVSNIDELGRIASAMLSAKSAGKCFEKYVEYNLINNATEALNILAIAKEAPELELQATCQKVINWMKHALQIETLNYGECTPLPPKELRRRKDMLENYTDIDVPDFFIINPNEKNCPKDLLTELPKIADCTDEEIFLFQILYYIKDYSLKCLDSSKEILAIENNTIDLSEIIKLEELLFIYINLNSLVWKKIGERLGCQSSTLTLSKDWTIRKDISVNAACSNGVSYYLF